MKVGSLIMLLSAVVALHTLQAQDILPPVMPWNGASKKLIADPKDPWITPAETTGLTQSPDYANTLQWLEKLANSSPKLKVATIGTSEQGRPICMVIASQAEAFTPTALQQTHKPVILFQAGIHAGEIDGKDAGMMLLRDIAHGPKAALLKEANLLFIPVLNVDGHERKSPYGRVNQRGPVEMGWRTNAQNLNLNRDYTKLETAGIQTVVQVINQYHPDLYIDIHVTDGADYQYDITYGYITGSPYSPHISDWFTQYFQPAVDAALAKQGHIPGPLLFAANGKDFSAGKILYNFGPRFSHSYGDARHLPTILVENHSLKPFSQRVLGTYVFLEQAIHSVSKHDKTLTQAIQADQQQRVDSLAISFKTNAQRHDSLSFLGIEHKLVHSDITGADYVQWMGKPIQQKIASITIDKPDHWVKIPTAYYIPAEWPDIIERLAQHGVVMEILDKPVTKNVNTFYIEDYSLASQPLEGHVRIDQATLKTISREITYAPGSARILTQQPLGVLTTLLLEPSSADSFFQWGYFHTILSQTEYIEGYVMEPLAAKMLQEDADLKARFEQHIKTDSMFAQSPQQIYRWFYEQTPYFDQQWKVIPIGREE